MTLYFRMLVIFIKTILFEKNNKGLDNDIELTMRVLPHDLDIFRHVNNGRYLTLMDLGRFHLLLKTGALGKILKQGYKPHILNAFLKYKKEMKLFEKFTLKTKVVYWDDKNIYIRHLFIKNNQVCAEAIIKGILVCKNKKVSPQQFINELDLNISCPEQPSYLNKFREMCDEKIESI